jgi:hypothetical protein
VVNKLVVKEMGNFARCVSDRKGNEQSGVDARVMGVVYPETLDNEHVLRRDGVVKAVVDNGEEFVPLVQGRGSRREIPLRPG